MVDDSLTTQNNRWHEVRGPAKGGVELGDGTPLEIFRATPKVEKWSKDIVWVQALSLFFPAVYNTSPTLQIFLATPLHEVPLKTMAATLHFSHMKVQKHAVWKLATPSSIFTSCESEQHNLSAVDTKQWQEKFLGSVLMCNQTDLVTATYARGANSPLKCFSLYAYT